MFLLGLFLSLYTIQPGIVVRVPNVKGLEFRDARARLVDAGLEIRGDQGRVLKQTPDAGKDARTGGVVFVQVQAPDVPAPKPEKPEEPEKSVLVEPMLVPPVEQVKEEHHELPAKATVTDTSWQIVEGYRIVLPAGGGPPVLVPDKLIVFGTPPTPGPTPVPPVPGVLSDRAKAIKAAADKAVGDAKRAETAQGLAAIYREIASSAKAPATPESISSNAIRFTDFITDHQGSTAAWAPMREVLRGQIADEIRKGNNGDPVTVEQLGILLSEVADGLEASAPKQAGVAVYKTPAGNSVSGISPEFWQFLLELLKILQQLLLK